MRVMLATLCLNEMEWLPHLYEQHKNWPGLVRWCFVESADVTYARANPERVSKDGLSVDGTTEFLESLAKTDPFVTHIKHGFCSAPQIDQAKCQARQCYLDDAKGVSPHILVVLDADEFYSSRCQALLCAICESAPNGWAYLFPQRHLWYPYRSPEEKPGLSALCTQEVIGGYWDVPHFRVWRWNPQMRYLKNHNWPEDANGTFFTRGALRFDSSRAQRRAAFRYNRDEFPACVHTGFCSLIADRKAKHSYYIARGEGTGDRRKMYLDCRTAYEEWTPGRTLPHGARVVPYNGPIPEVFLPPVSTEHHPDERSSRPDELLSTPQHPPGDAGVG